VASPWMSPLAGDAKAGRGLEQNFPLFNWAKEEERGEVATSRDLNSLKTKGWFATVSGGGDQAQQVRRSPRRLARIKGWAQSEP